MFTLLFFIVAPIAIVIIGFVIYDTIRQKGEFGIALNPPKCPGCGFQVFEIGRRPGWGERNLNRNVCPTCGFLSDQWGEELPVFPLLPGKEVQKKTEIYTFNSPLDSEGRSPVERALGDESSD
jgi:hypothetical protein